MKKIYFLLIAMLCSVAANADVYVYGNLGTGSWDSKTKAEGLMTDLGNGIFAWTTTTAVGDKYFRIFDSTTSKDYGWDGNGDYWINNFNEWTDPLKNKTDKAIYLKCCASSGSNPKGITILFDLNNGKVKVQKNAEKYGVKGSFTSNSWDTNNMIEVDGKWVIKDLEVTYASAAFGISALVGTSQVRWIRGKEATAQTITEPTETTEYDCVIEEVGGSNWNIAQGTYTLSFDPATMKLSVVVPEQTQTPDPTYTVDLMTSADWNNATLTTTEVTDGVANLVVAEWAEGTAFKIRVNNVWYGAGNTAGNKIVSGEEYTDVCSDEDLEGARNFTLPATATGKEVTFVVNVENAHFTATWDVSEAEVPAEWDTHYVVYFQSSQENAKIWVWGPGGNQFEGVWNDRPDMTKLPYGNYWAYEFENPNLNCMSNLKFTYSNKNTETENFKFVNHGIYHEDDKGGTEPTDRVAPIKPGELDEGLELVGNAISGTVNGETFSMSFTMPAGHVLKYKVTPEDAPESAPAKASAEGFIEATGNTIEVPVGKGSIEVTTATGDTTHAGHTYTYDVVGETTGLGAIAVDNATAVQYFNLQGIEVSEANLTPGLYIRRQGKVSTKVVIR